MLQRLTVRITAFERPGYFEDEMVRGAFREMRHRHEFESLGNGSTRMTDVFVFRAPLGVLGKLVEMVLLERYMRAFLVERNRVIKAVAEGEDWRKYVGPGVG